MDPAPPSARRRWSFGRKLALQLVLLPVLLLTVELLLRGWRLARGETYHAEQALESVQRVADAMDQTFTAPQTPDPANQPEEGTPPDPDPRKRPVQMFLHPYLGFAPENFTRSFERELTYFKSDLARKNYDILVVGGSVAAQFCQYGGVPLVEQLMADPRFAGRRVRLSTFPTGGFKQQQQLDLVAYIFGLGYEPEAVLDIDGFNELALGNYNARHASHPMHPSLSHWAHLIQRGALDKDALDLAVDMRLAQRRARGLADFATRYPVCESAVLGQLTLSAMYRYRSEYTSKYERYVQGLASTDNPTRRGPAYSTALSDVLDVVERNWSEASRSISGMCAVRGVYYVHILQPTLHDAGSKPLTEAEIETSTPQDGWLEAVRDGYPRLRVAGEKLRDEGIHFVDCSRIFADVREDLYYDACHFNAAGNEIFAREIAKAFLAGLPDSLPPARGSSR